MPVYIECDYSECDATAPAVIRAGRLGYPSGWWVPVGNDRIIVACCGEHLTKVLRETKGNSTDLLGPNISK